MINFETIRYNPANGTFESVLYGEVVNRWEDISELLALVDSIRDAKETYELDMLFELENQD
jgi:hypothetical protein